MTECPATLTLATDHLGAAAAARHLGIAVATAAKLRCRGGGPPFHKLGRKIVYSRADLDAWLRVRRVRNTIDADKLPHRMTEEPRSA